MCLCLCCLFARLVAYAGGRLLYLRRIAADRVDRVGSRIAGEIAWDRVGSRRSRGIAWDRGSRGRSRGIAWDRVGSRGIARDRVGSRGIA